MSILILALVKTVIHTIVMVKLDIGRTPLSILRFDGLTLIVAGGLMLVTAGYSNDQTAPVSGLLGAQAGYLLGDRS